MGTQHRSVVKEPLEGKEMFNLTSHLTHFILRLYGVGWLVGLRLMFVSEGSVLFNDTLNTF